MILFIHPVPTHHQKQPISTVWASIRNSPRLHLNNRRDLSKVQGQLNTTDNDLPSVQETHVSPKEYEQINQISAFYDESSEIVPESHEPITSPHASKSEIDIAVTDQQTTSNDVLLNHALDYLETAHEITLLELQTVMNINQSTALLLINELMAIGALDESNADGLYKATDLSYQKTI